MKETYKSPTVEEITFCPEQRILALSYMTLMAITSPSDDAKDMIINDTEAW